MNLPKTMLHIRLETELVEQLDVIAQATKTKRSELIRRSVIDTLRAECGQILPAVDGINVWMMTDQQLEELWDIVITERMRRRRRQCRG